MKVLFKLNEYTDIQAVPVKVAMWEVDAHCCTPAFTPDEQAYIDAHADDVLLSLSNEDAAKKLLGAFLMDSAALALTDCDEGGVRGFASNDIEVRRVPGGDFICGASEPEKLKEFAVNLRKSAKEDAAAMLKTAGVYDKVVDEQMLESPVNVMGDASQAFAIMANEPAITMYAGIYSDWIFGGYMKCWPDDEELSEILANPSNYAVAEVTFK